MPRVLIVEDSLDLANMVRSMLEFEGLTVDACHDGQIGLHHAISRPYDLLILDWDLPGMSGIDILNNFRRSGATTPVIMLTGKSSIEEKEMGLDCGADDYLTKPFNMKELGARVRAMLRRAGKIAAGASASTTTNFGDISIDHAASRASRAGQTYMLTPQELTILQFAANYPHIKPAVQDLVQLAWSGDPSGEEKLQTAIRRLRKKLDQRGERIFPHLYPDLAAISGAGAISKDNFSSEKFKANLEDDPTIGTILDGKYEMIEAIGGGGAGQVYRARHTKLDRPCAIKMLYLVSVNDTEAVQRFEREARIAASLNHPNIISVRDFGVSEQGRPYLEMELAEGASLAEIKEAHGRPDVSEVLDVFIQLTRALCYIHSKGMVHRDVKPSNIMLTCSPGETTVTVKLVDLGLTRPSTVSGSLAKITQTGVVLGSPSYMSPEQCRGEDTDGQSDIYSLGCSFYELLHGEVPFVGKDPIDIIVKHVVDEPPSLRVDTGNPRVDRCLCDIAARCLAKEKNRRFTCAEELLQALTECRAQVDASGAASHFHETTALPEHNQSQSWRERKNMVKNWLSGWLGNGG